MGFDKKKTIIAGAAAVAVVGVVAGTAIAVSGDSGSLLTGDPAPGTYSQAPREIGTHKIEFTEERIWGLPLTDNSFVYHQEIPGAYGSDGTKLVGVDLETGAAWENALDNFVYCNTAEYADDARMIVCQESSAATIYDPKDGSEVATIPEIQGNLSVTNDTLYACWRENGTFKLSARTAPDFTENLLATVPADTEYPCRFSLQGDNIAIYSNKNWVTVLKNDGTILHQDFENQGTLNSAGLLETAVFNEDDPLEDRTFSVVNLDGTKVFEYSEPISEVPSIPGGRDSGIFIDEYGAVRERATGTVRWTYSAPNHFGVVGLAGNTLVMVEDGIRLRAYNVDDGTAMWATSTENVLPKKAESLPGDPGGFSPEGSLHRVAGDGETLVFASGTRLTALDVASGEILWELGTGGWFTDEYQDHIVLSDNELLRILRFE